MKSNIIPSLIIAVAIVLSAIYSQWASKRAAESAFADFERAVSEKNAGGKTRVSQFTHDLVSSVVDGFKAGFSDVSTKNTPEETVSDSRRSISVREVHLAYGDSANKERVIGLVRNNGQEEVSNVIANVIFNAHDGALIDVQSNVRLVDGVIHPGEELGFKVERELGEFGEDEQVLRGRKATSVALTVVKAEIHKKKE